MNKNFNKAYDNIDIALEISSATLSIISDHTEDETISWALSGVHEQLDKIRDNMNEIDNMLNKKAVSI